VVIVATGGGLKNVNVTVGRLDGPGSGIPSENIEVSPVGFVRLTRPNGFGEYPVESTYAGWWPEILLKNFGFDVAVGDSQPVWLSIRIPREASAGVYRTDITVAPENMPKVSLSLEVEVVDYELPRTWHFRNSLSFHNGWCKDFYGARWTPEMRSKFLDFLLDRRINLTSMYGDTDFKWEEICRGMERGQNVIFVYTLDSPSGLKEAPWLKPETEKRARAVLDQWVPKLREKGWLDRAYLYGFDEVGPELFPAAKHTFQRFKNGYPVQTISTLYDYSFGLDTGLTGAFDNFMPHMEKYNVAQADLARAKGTKVWWYETLWNIEQPLIRSRLIPWMTFKVRADGFLIWCMNRWRGEGAPKVKRDQWKTNTAPVKNTILNEWDPWLDGVCPNSSANYIYPGEEGPLSCLRLECFRDGIEDYDLLMAAAERRRELAQEGGDKNAVALLDAALTIDETFIKDAIQSNYSGADLKAHRQRLLRALVATGRGR